MNLIVHKKKSGRLNCLNLNLGQYNLSGGRYKRQISQGLLTLQALRIPSRHGFKTKEMRCVVLNFFREKICKSVFSAIFLKTPNLQIFRHFFQSMASIHAADGKCRWNHQVQFPEWNCQWVEADSHGKLWLKLIPKKKNTVPLLTKLWLEPILMQGSAFCSVKIMLNLNRDVLSNNPFKGSRKRRPRR